MCFVSECEIEQIDIWSEIVKRVSMLGESRSWWVRGWSMLFTCGWGWYVVEICLWPILGVEVRSCLNFCDEKNYLSWPGANRAEVGEMGHPAQGRGICVDNARYFKILKSWKMGVFWVIKCVLSVNVRLSKLIFEVRLWRGYWCWVKVGHGEWGVNQCYLHVGGDGMWWRCICDLF